MREAEQSLSTGGEKASFDIDSLVSLGQLVMAKDRLWQVDSALTPLLLSDPSFRGVPVDYAQANDGLKKVSSEVAVGVLLRCIFQAADIPCTGLVTAEQGRHIIAEAWKEVGLVRATAFLCGALGKKFAEPGRLFSEIQALLCAQAKAAPVAPGLSCSLSPAPRR